MTGLTKTFDGSIRATRNVSGIRRRSQRGYWPASLASLALPIPYRSAPLATWGFGLAAYPRVSGGILLWLALVWRRKL